MGTWGHGNFENDTAANYFCELCSPLMDQIRSTAADDGSMESDEYDSEVMLANIEILTVLVAHIGRAEKDEPGDVMFRFPVPEENKVKEWRTRYLKVWNAYIDDLDPSPDCKVKRLSHIKATFDKFIEISGTLPRLES